MTKLFLTRMSALVAIVGALAMPPREAQAELPCMGSYYWVGYWAESGECPTYSLAEFCAGAFPTCGTPTSASCSSGHWGPDYGYGEYGFAKVTCVYGES
jgi:hypothetical protein